MVRNGSFPTIDGPPSTSGSSTIIQREGTVSALMQVGTQLLGRNQVLPGVASLVSEVQVEATFPDGTKLLTVHNPIGRENGNLVLALEGSFLPVPDVSIFDPTSTTTTATTDEYDDSTVIPGQMLISPTLPNIEINPSRSLIEVCVTNTGDRPIQVGSHYPFLETNAALVFDRKLALG